MNYTALYRKFRPKKFEDIVGQEHITRTLRNQIISSEKVPNLFQTDWTCLIFKDGNIVCNLLKISLGLQSIIYLVAICNDIFL